MTSFDVLACGSAFPWVSEPPHSSNVAFCNESKETGEELRDKRETRLARSLMLRIIKEVSEPPLASVRHRVINDFSLVHALLGMAMRKTDDVLAKKLLKASRARVRVIALFHSVAWREESDGPSECDARAYLGEIVRESERAYGDRERVRVELALGNVGLALAETIAVGLVTSELVINALEHAFPGERRGRVSVTLSEPNAENEVALAVSDDGVGLPDGRFENSGAGLGFTVVRLLAEQLGARLDLRSSHDHGTDFSLRFARTRESRPWQTS